MKFLIGPFALSLLSNLVGTTVVSSEGQRRKPQGRIQRRIDYTRFSHTTHVTQQGQTCDSCHKFPTANWNEVRQGGAAFPDVAEFPQHTACLDCHRAQFFARERPAPSICANCHVNVTPRDTARFLFPSLGDISGKRRRNSPSEFAIQFPHDKHVDVVGLNAPRARFVTISWQEKQPGANEQPKSCPVCHQTYQPQGDSDEEYATKPPTDLGDKFWLKKGTFKTAPNSHATCFTCHNVEAGIAPAPSDCGVCHKPASSSRKPDFDPKLIETIGLADRTIVATWLRRISSGSFRHEAGEHPNINCLNCHNVSTMNTSDVKSLIVPIRSCGGAEGCHVTATLDEGGILNYEIDQKNSNTSFVCTKCHLGYANGSVPSNHVDAIAKAKK